MSSTNRFEIFIVLLMILYKTGVSQSAMDKLNSMFREIDNLETAEFTLSTEERLIEGMVKGKSFVKYNRSPYKVYYKQIIPDEGLEIVFNEEEYGDKAIVVPNTFPYISFKSSPYNYIMMKGRHHTLYEISVYPYMGKIIDNMIQNHRDNIQVIDSGIVRINDVLCYKIAIKAMDYHVLDYKVKEGENIIDIGRKHHVGFYKLVELNDNIKSMDDVKPGQVIKIPDFYAKEFILYIDRKTNLPVLIKIFDDKGLYEQYYLNKVKINQYYPDSDFIR